MATLFVIVGTANHFLLDAVGGVLTFAVALGDPAAAFRPPAPYRTTPIVLPEVPLEPELVAVSSPA